MAGKTKRQRSAAAAKSEPPPSGTRSKAKGRRAPSGKVMNDLSLFEQFQRIGGQMTPTQVSQIIREADLGFCRRLMDLGNEARQKDGHLSAVLSQSEEAIAGLEWKLEIDPKATKRDKDAAKWVETWLRTKVGQAFSTLIAHLAGAPFYSFAVSEIQWGKDPKNRLAPVDFENQSQRRFRFREEDGKLVWWDYNMPAPGVDFREEYPNRFVTAQPRVTGDVPAREGLIRVLLWAALFRTWNLTDWLRTGETAWKPWRIGYYEKGASDEDIDGLLEVLDRLASTGTAALPKTTEAKIEWPGGSASSKVTHAELFNVLAQEMSKAALGQTETVQSSDSTGYAQAKVHDDVKSSLLRARARYIAAVITRDVIRPMIELNFGLKVLVPMFAFDMAQPLDLKAFSDALKGFTSPQGAGLRVPAKWARAEAGIPDPEDGEEVVGAAAAEGTEPGEAPAEGEKPEAEPTEPSPDDNEGAPEDSGEGGGKTGGKAPKRKRRTR